MLVVAAAWVIRKIIIDSFSVINESLDRIIGRPKDVGPPGAWNTTQSRASSLSGSASHPSSRSSSSFSFSSAPSLASSPLNSRDASAALPAIPSLPHGSATASAKSPLTFDCVATMYVRKDESHDTLPYPAIVQVTQFYPQIRKATLSDGRSSINAWFADEFILPDNMVHSIISIEQFKPKGRT